MYLKKKFLCGSLIFAFLMQSCAVYQKIPVTISEAVATDKKILITKTDDTKQKFRKIEQIDGRYFGIIIANDKLVNVPIVESEIKSIRPLNKRATTLGTVGIFSGVALIVLSIIGINAANDAAKQMTTLPSIP